MDIGTAKVSQEKRRYVSHHLIDIIEPDSDFSAEHFRQEATNLIFKISTRGKIPFVVGGTGLYFKSLIYGLFEGPGKDKDLRNALEKLIKEKGVLFLHQKLKEVDPQTAEKVHFNDKKRVIRALEVYELTQKPISEFWKNQSKGDRTSSSSGVQDGREQEKESFHFLKIGLTQDRNELYRRIDDRCDEMLASGFVEEVKSLKNGGFSPDLQSMQAIGYKHIYQYLDGEINLAEMVRQFKRDTRRFAKRQWTLFLRFKNVFWFSPKEINKIKTLISHFLTENN